MARFGLVQVARAWISLAIIAVISIASSANGATHYVSPSGSDDTSGRRGAPWRTLDKALNSCRGGDTVMLAEGDYTFTARPGNATLFASLVTVKKLQEAERAATRITNAITIGNRDAGHFFTNFGEGTFYANLRFEDLTLADGIGCFGAKNLQLSGCMINRKGDVVGSRDAIEKIAVEIAGSDCLVERCEVTRTAVGLALNGWRLAARENHIHDNSHDGIRFINAKDCIAERNHIHGIDDGVSDTEADWSRHADGIHVFMANTQAGYACERLTIYGNRIYDTESHGFHENTHPNAEPGVTNKDFLIENNVFGPTGAQTLSFTDPVDGVIIRHNTFSHFPGGRSFVTPYRTIHLTDSVCYVSERQSNVRIYNNIFEKTLIASADRPDWFIDYNFVPFPSSPTTRHQKSGDQGLVDPGNFDGKTRPDSPAVNAGTMLYVPKADGPLPSGLNGVARDARPDMGVYELADLSPPPEPALAPAPAAPSTFLDDFLDGDITKSDPWLTGPSAVGLTWEVVEGNYGLRLADGRNELSPSQSGTVTDMVLATPPVGPAFALSFEATNHFATQGDGVILLNTIAGDYYWLDLGNAEGSLHRVVGGARKKIAASTAVRLPHGESKRYLILVRASPTGVRFAVDAGAVDGVADLTFEDTDVGAITAFLGGGRVGFRREPYTPDLRNHYRDVRIDLNPEE